MTPVSLEGQILGRYRVLEPLGRGGMARVYRAYHPQLDRYVAIKVLRSDLVEDDEFLTRFRREAQAVAGLRHAHIVQVFDFDIQGDMYYMVMELLAGDTLKSRLNDYRVREERMPLGESVRIMLDVLDGLSYAHSEGMIHRDIKPANILLTKRGEAVLGDFGIAHIVGGTRYTASGALLGTLRYMAPEQGLEGVCDERSDIYSLGIVLYEMLTQRPPFEADTPLAVLMKHVNDPLPSPCSVNPALPKVLERVVLKALSKEPDDRYQSAGEMSSALHRAASEAEIALPEAVSVRESSFSTAEAPSESVEVFSGTARERITDVEFADDDTSETATVQPDDYAEAAETELESAPGWRSGLGGAILTALAIILVGNLAMVTVAAPTGYWRLYEIGWPIQILLVGFGLAYVMYRVEGGGLLIPTGTVLTVGMLLAYSSVTGLWSQWRFLWLFLVWGVAGMVLAQVLIIRHVRSKRDVGRFLGMGFMVISIVGIALTGAGAGVSGLIAGLRQLLDL